MGLSRVINPDMIVWDQQNGGGLVSIVAAVKLMRFLDGAMNLVATSLERET